MIFFLVLDEYLSKKVAFEKTTILQFSPVLPPTARKKP
jgi:hypothetical protein